MDGSLQKPDRSLSPTSPMSIKIATNCRTPCHRKNRGSAHGLLCLTALLAGLSPGASQGAFPEAALLATGCEGCHGTGGEGLGVFPSIRGLEPALFLKRLDQLDQEAPGSTPMHRLSRAFSPEDRRRLAHYFSHSGAP